MPEQPFCMAFTVDKSSHATRLDLYLAKELKELGFSRERVKQFILQGNVLLNAKNARLPREEVREGDRVEIFISQISQGGEACFGGEPSPKAEEGHLSIIWQDASVLIVNKPAGLTVHPCPSCPENTLVNILLHHFPSLASTSGLRPGIVHRLDKDTSGLLAIALDEGTRLKLSHSFAMREVHKKYLAIAAGVFKEKEGEINLPMGRHPKNKTIMSVQPGGREAISLYKVLFQGENFALLEVEILTGRTHQIRVHLAAMGHPLWGDKVYGGPQTIRSKIVADSSQTSPASSSFSLQPLKTIKRQMLHAFELSFAHPQTKEPLAFTCPPPEDFMLALASLTEQPLKVVITGLPGCGKSALLKVMQNLDLPTFSADQSVREEYGKTGNARHLLTARFAGKFNTFSGDIDRPLLFSAMQESPSLKNEVESMVHPIIEHNLREFYALHEAFSLVFAEIPLYLEAGWARGAKKEVDLNLSRFLPLLVNSPDITINQGVKGGGELLVGVSCPRELRYQRLKSRGVPENVAETLDSWQWEESKKMRACHIVIDNSGSLEELGVAGQELVKILVSVRSGMNKALLDMTTGGGLLF